MQVSAHVKKRNVTLHLPQCFRKLPTTATPCTFALAVMTAEPIREAYFSRPASSPLTSGAEDLARRPVKTSRGIRLRTRKTQFAIAHLLPTHSSLGRNSDTASSTSSLRPAWGPMPSANDRQPSPNHLICSSRMRSSAKCADCMHNRSDLCDEICTRTVRKF